MPVDRKLFSQTLSKNRVPAWLCPTCGLGFLRHRDGSMHEDETAQSKAMHYHAAWEPEWITYRFSALLQCSNDECGESVAVTGTGDVSQCYDVDEGCLYIDSFTPTHVEPSPDLIPIHAAYPGSVALELRRSFVASWGDFSAAGTHIRTAMERLLDHLSVPSSRDDGRPIPLSSRIDEYGKRNGESAQVAHALQAIKWLGNAGSHTDVLTRDDVYDALDIVDVVLEDLFINDRRRIQALIDGINATKGPLSREDSGSG